MNTAAELNSHSEPYWNTPLMQLLRDLRECVDVSVADQQRAQILGLLDIAGIDLLESDFKGDTALHYAIWCGEFDIAAKIIEKTPDADKPLLFAARNTVGLTHDTDGEMPHMNLAFSGQRVFVRFLCDPSTDIQAQLSSWLRLCETFSCHVDNGQLAGLTHLMQVCRKELKKYNKETFLQAAPISEFNKLMTECGSFKAQQPAHVNKVEGLLRQLILVKQNFSEKAIDDLLGDLRQKIAAEQTLPAAASSASSENPVLEFYRCASEVLTRLKDYVTGLSATLVPMAAAAVASVPLGQNPASLFANSAAATRSVSSARLSDKFINRIAQVDAYRQKKSGDQSDPRYLGANDLYVKLAAFQAQFQVNPMATATLASYIHETLQHPTYSGMFAAILWSDLKMHFNGVLDSLNAMGCSLGDENYADEVERLADGYKVHGRNNTQQHRYVVMYDDGRVRSHSGEKLGVVEMQLYHDHVNIFRKFGVELPEKSQEVRMAPVGL